MGMRGMKCLYDVIDEVNKVQHPEEDERHIWRYIQLSDIFTPEEFNKVWDTFPKSQKIDYVLFLIQGA